MKRSTVLVVLALLAGVGRAWAQPTTPPTRPSNAFATKSLQALSSVPGEAGRKWRAVVSNRRQAVMKAIAGAERKGWKPTKTSVYATKGTPSSPRLRPISFSPVVAQQYFSSGDGEMLVWDWDDGNPTTAEGTIWVHSYWTGNEVMFNVQLAGDTYDNMYIAYSEDVYATFADPNPERVVFHGPVGMSAPRLVKAGLVAGQRCSDYGHQCEQAHQNQCNYQWMNTGASCLGRASRERLRDGLRGSAASAAVGGVGGAFAGGLAGAVTGATAGAASGFLSGVLGSLIWGTDFECRGDARQTYDSCMAQPVDYSMCYMPQGCRLP